MDTPAARRRPRAVARGPARLGVGSAVLLAALALGAAAGVAARPDSLLSSIYKLSVTGWTVSKRTGLVLAVVGDESEHQRWLDTRPKDAGWDLAVLYYGKDSSFSCPECVYWAFAKGGKWEVLHKMLSNEQGPLAAEKITAKYPYVLFSDDDLIITGAEIDAAMRIADRYGLKLWQTSICPNSSIHWKHLRQDPNTVLRFTNFVELMAPCVSSDVLVEVVLPTLQDARTGWGLDYAWAKALDYQGVAIVDAVCMTHRTKTKHGLYTSAPGETIDDAYDELFRNVKRYKIPYSYVREPHTPRTLIATEPARPYVTLGEVPWNEEIRKDFSDRELGVPSDPSGTTQAAGRAWGAGERPREGAAGRRRGGANNPVEQLRLLNAGRPGSAVGGAGRDQSSVAANAWVAAIFAVDLAAAACGIVVFALRARWRRHRKATPP